MTVWDWVQEALMKAYQEGDDDRIRLYRIFRDSAAHADSDPDLRLSQLAEGRALAEQLNEPWWALFFDHWSLQMLLNKKRDIESALPLAVRATVEARRPVYAAFPQRVCLHEDLISAYATRDPVGHAEKITAALEYMEREAAPGIECHACIRGLRRDFLVDCGDLAAAEQEAMRSLQEAPDWHRCQAFAALCGIAYRTGFRDDIAGYARAGDEAAERSGNRAERYELRLWSAVAARHTGNEEEARRHYRWAIAQVSRLGMVPARGYYQALAAFHEMAGDLVAAIKVRQDQLTRLAGTGQTFVEAEVQTERCQLLDKLGLLTEADLEQARTAVSKLLQPASFEQRLDALAPSA